MRNKLLTFFCIVGISVQAFAGVTGKIVGKVKEKESGEPIVGANVVIVGTSLGAAVDVSGDYYIINVPPGKYSLRASSIAHQAVTITNIEVSSDITTTINFEMSAANVQLQEVVVKAERPLIEVSATSTIRRTSSEDIAAIPRENVQGLVALSAGVVDGQNFRGGRSTENLFQVDGMSVTNPQNGGFGGEGARSTYFSTVSPLAIEEVQVITGGFTAEYGNALSGVVNTVTKEGSMDRYEGTIRTKFDVPQLNGYSDKDVQLGGLYEQLYEFSFGGPLKLGYNSSFFIASKFDYQKYRLAGYKWVDLSGNNTGELPHNQMAERNINAKFAFAPVEKIKVTLSGFYGISMWENATWAWMYGDYTQQPSSVQSNQQLFARMTHTLDNSTFYELTASYFGQNYSAGKKVESSNFNNLTDVYDIFGFDDANNDGIVDKYFGYGKDGYEVNPATGHREGNAFTQGNRNPYGVVGASANVTSFVMFGNSRTFRQEKSEYVSLNGAVTSQMNKYNLIKAGFDVKMHTVHTQYNSLPWDANPFADDYTYKPLQTSAYVQNKMEYKGLILNPGIRFDYLDPKASKIINLLNPGNPPALTEAKAKTQISPRFGISFGLTERSKFYLNYGWYFQEPVLSRLYEQITELNLSRGNQIFGNPDLEPQRTKAFEVGYGNQFTDMLSIDITAYYKDLFNIEGVTFIPASPSSFTLYSTGEYGNVRGVEISLSKRLDNYWRARATYAYSVAKGTASNVTSNYQLVTNGPPDPYLDGGSKVYPLTDYYLDFDRRHVVNVILDFVIPQGDGPTISGVHFLQGLNVNFTTVFRTGTPYTRVNNRNIQVGEYNGARQPDFTQTDLRISRDIALSSLFGESFGKMSMVLYADVTNLFDRVVATSFYEKTGVADNDGFEVSTPSQTPWTSGSVDAAGFPYYTANIDLNKDGINDQGEKLYGINKLRQDYFDSRNNGRFQTARRIWLGVTLRF